MGIPSFCSLQPPSFPRSTFPSPHFAQHTGSAHERIPTIPLYPEASCSRLSLGSLVVCLILCCLFPAASICSRRVVLRIFFSGLAGTPLASSSGLSPPVCRRATLLPDSAFGSPLSLCALHYPFLSCPVAQTCLQHCADGPLSTKILGGCRSGPRTFPVLFGDPARYPYHPLNHPAPSDPRA